MWQGPNARCILQPYKFFYLSSHRYFPKFHHIQCKTNNSVAPVWLPREACYNRISSQDRLCCSVILFDVSLGERICFEYSFMEFWNLSVTFSERTILIYYHFDINSQISTKLSSMIRSILLHCTSKTFQLISKNTKICHMLLLT